MTTEPKAAPTITPTGEGPVGCKNCGDTAGPFDPTTGLCEDCLPGGAA